MHMLLTYVCVCVYISLSLSLSIYIYIYIYTYMCTHNIRYLCVSVRILRIP